MLLHLKDTDIMHLGRHEGKELQYIPLQYLIWVAEMHELRAFSAEYDDFNDALLDYVEYRRNKNEIS